MLIWYFVLGVVEELLKVALFFHLSNQSYIDVLHGMRSRSRTRTPYADSFIRKHAGNPTKVQKFAAEKVQKYTIKFVHTEMFRLILIGLMNPKSDIRKLVQRKVA